MDERLSLLLDLTNNDDSLAMPRMQRVSYLVDRPNMGIVLLASITASGITRAWATGL
jgi:hypothetical protein